MRPLGVGSSVRGATAAAVLSALALVPAVPHLVEDAARDAFAVSALDHLTLGLVTGAALSGQVLSAFGALRQRRVGYVGVLAFAVVWVVATVVDHPGAFLPGDFRAGMSSRLAVVGLVATQLGAALAAAVALRATRRTSSFTGTGSFG